MMFTGRRRLYIKFSLFAHFCLILLSYRFVHLLSDLVGEIKCIFSFFFFSKNVDKSVRFAIDLNWFKLPMKVIDRTKAVTQHFLENSFQKLLIKKKIKK